MAERSKINDEIIPDDQVWTWRVSKPGWPQHIQILEGGTGDAQCRKCLSYKHEMYEVDLVDGTGTMILCPECLLLVSEFMSHEDNRCPVCLFHWTSAHSAHGGYYRCQWGHTWNREGVIEEFVE